VHTALEWEELFGERVPCAAVRPIEDMFDHPQVLAEDLVATLDHPQVGRYRAMKEPVRFTDTPGAAPTPAPTFGKHSDEILAGCGYSVEDMHSAYHGAVCSRHPRATRTGADCPCPDDRAALHCPGERVLDKPEPHDNPGEPTRTFRPAFGWPSSRARSKRIWIWQLLPMSPAGTP
jgi:hypothetical protein